jgi:hypothetical protein
VTVVADAERAVSEFPLREGFWAALMLAQYRSGRQSDALRSFRRLSSVLGEELGIEPSAELRDLEEAILLQRARAGLVPQRPNLRHQRKKALPTGTVTFLSTDIEGSTALLEQVGDDAFEELLQEHHRIVREAARPITGSRCPADDAGFFAVCSPRPARRWPWQRKSQVRLEI